MSLSCGGPELLRSACAGSASGCSTAPISQAIFQLINCVELALRWWWKASSTGQPQSCPWPGDTSQRIGSPDRVRAITRRWISLVPSKMV